MTKTDRFVNKLIRKQTKIDAKAREMAMGIVCAQNLKTLESAKRFAPAWIETAAQFARNAEYWRDRARRAEKKLELG